MKDSGYQKRTQKDYPMSFKLAVVEEVEKGTFEMIATYPNTFVGIGPVKERLSDIKSTLNGWWETVSNKTAELRELEENARDLFNVFDIVESDMMNARREWIIANHNTASNLLRGEPATAAYIDWVACYSFAFTGIPNNMLRPSIEGAGIDPDNIPPSERGRINFDDPHQGAKAWRDIWSAGQGVDAITSTQSVAEIVSELTSEYVRAVNQLETRCLTPDLTSLREEGVSPRRVVNKLNRG